MVMGKMYLGRYIIYCEEGFRWHFQHLRRKVWLQYTDKDKVLWNANNAKDSLLDFGWWSMLHAYEFTGLMDGAHFHPAGPPHRTQPTKSFPGYRWGDAI